MASIVIIIIAIIVLITIITSIIPDPEEFSIIDCRILYEKNFLVVLMYNKKHKEYKEVTYTISWMHKYNVTSFTVYSADGFIVYDKKLTKYLQKYVKKCPPQ